MPDSSPTPQLLSHLRGMLAAPAESGATAILTTVSLDGWPHAAWMGTATAPDCRTVYSLTSPDSAKVRHLQANPKSEWMMVDAARETVLYLRGQSKILEDITEIKRVWQWFPDKSRAYFLSFFNSAPGYAVIQTPIAEVEWVQPMLGRRGHLPPDLLTGGE